MHKRVPLSYAALMITIVGAVVTLRIIHTLNNFTTDTAVFLLQGNTTHTADGFASDNTKEVLPSLQ